jgi:23S rRNA pseudouridine1911/1915/1917 synthase
MKAQKKPTKLKKVAKKAKPAKKAKISKSSAKPKAKAKVSKTPAASKVIYKGLPVEILYEDAHIVAVNKPAGLVVHSDGRTVEPFLTDWVLEHYPQAKNVGEPIVTNEFVGADGVTRSAQTIYRPGIVHRLDRETSGVMLVAKTAIGHAHLKAQFQEHTMKKKYHAFLYGELKEDWGIIDRPIGKSTSDFRKWSATRGARGELRDAQTWWSLIKAGSDLDVSGKYSFVLAEPKTGRTHQIRVHFKAINHPVVHDRLYSSERFQTGNGKIEKHLDFNRTALHASSITFVPVPSKTGAGKPITVIAPFPADFIHAMKEMNILAVDMNATAGSPVRMIV